MEAQLLPEAGPGPIPAQRHARTPGQAAAPCPSRGWQRGARSVMLTLRYCHGAKGQHQPAASLGLSWRWPLNVSDEKQGAEVLWCLGSAPAAPGGAGLGCGEAAGWCFSAEL